MWSHWITDANLCRKCFQFYCCKFPIGVILFRIFHCIATDWEIFLGLEKCSFVKVSTMSTVSPCKKCQQCHILHIFCRFWHYLGFEWGKWSTYKIRIQNNKKNTFLGLGQGQRPGWCHYWREKGVQQGRLQEHEGFVRIFFIYFLFCLYFYTKGDYKNMKNMWGTMIFKHFCL